jgi:hypothetical protein
MTVRGDILGHIETTLGNITGVGDVSVGKFRDVDVDAVRLPCVFADYSNDRPGEGSSGFETFVVPVEIEAWCTDTNRETFLGLVHAALMADYTQGGHALNTTRTTCQTLFVDPGRHLSGFILSFEILYRHPRGTP